MGTISSTTAGKTWHVKRIPIQPTAAGRRKRVKPRGKGKAVAGHPAAAGAASSHLSHAQQAAGPSRHCMPIRNPAKGKRLHSLSKNIKLNQQNAGKWWKMLNNPRRLPGLTPKFMKPWQGPFVVLKRINDLIYRIQHRNRLWEYSGPNPPTWYKKAGSSSSIFLRQESWGGTVLRPCSELVLQTKLVNYYHMIRHIVTNWYCKIMILTPS